MFTNNTLLSSTFNTAHRYSEPDQHPMKRMFLTRIAQIPCAAIEAAIVVSKTGELILLSAKELRTITAKFALKVFTHSDLLLNYSNSPSLLTEIRTKASELSRLVAGFASTIFIGLFFSPVTNFKIHLRLDLISDNFAEKKQLDLKTKLKQESQKAEITKAREERFAKIEAEMQAEKQAEAEAYAVDARLAELLLSVKIV